MSNYSASEAVMTDRQTDSYPALWNQTAQSFLLGQNEDFPWVMLGISALSKQESNSSIKHNGYVNSHILYTVRRIYVFDKSSMEKGASF